MKIVTWNINGIRATSRNQSLKDLLDSLEADVICLQETKITRNLLTDNLANVEGYLAFFSFSKRKSGYSGVATFCKKQFCPIGAEEGLTGLFTDKMEQTIGFYNNPPDLPEEVIRSLDSEGRCMITEHETPDGERLCIINVYCPRADVEDEERYCYKMNFYRLLQMRVHSLIKEKRNVIVVGDLNVSHKRIDSCDPCEDFEENPARKWLNTIIDNRTYGNAGMCSTSITDQRKSAGNEEKSFMEQGYEIPLFDTFRIFHPNEQNAYTCWNTQKRAREMNFGTRIDYILADRHLCNKLTNCVIRPDVQGSDHCPVVADFELLLKTSPLIPKACAILMPEIFGKQCGIKSFFGKDGGPGENIVKRKYESSNSSCFYKKRKLLNNSSSLLQHFKTPDVEISNISRSSNVVYSNVNNFSSNNCDVNSCLTLVDFESTNLFESSKQKAENKEKWKKILKGPAPAPLCTGHKEKAVLRTVKKQGNNLGRQFYACNRPVGPSNNKNAGCGFFVWKT